MSELAIHKCLASNNLHIALNLIRGVGFHSVGGIVFWKLQQIFQNRHLIDMTDHFSLSTTTGSQSLVVNKGHNMHQDLVF